MKTRIIKIWLFVRSLFYYLFHQRSEKNKQVLKFVDECFEYGLAFELKKRFDLDVKTAINIVRFANVKYGYDAKSIAGEETFKVKKFCFTKCYYNKLKKWQE